MVAAGHQREKLWGSHRRGLCHRAVEYAGKAIAHGADRPRNGGYAGIVFVCHRCRHHSAGRQTTQRLSGERLLVGIAVQYYRIGHNEPIIQAILLTNNKL